MNALLARYMRALGLVALLPFGRARLSHDRCLVWLSQLARIILAGVYLAATYALAPILDVLQEAGSQKANLGVEFACEIAKQVKPFTLVAVAFVAGLVFGRRGP